MKRREFLQTLAYSSLALSLPARLGRAGVAANIDDKLWVFFDANGAWDPTAFCDPCTHPDFTTYYDDNHIAEQVTDAVLTYLSEF